MVHQTLGARHSRAGNLTHTAAGDLRNAVHPRRWPAILLNIVGQSRGRVRHARIRVHVGIVGAGCRSRSSHCRGLDAPGHAIGNRLHARLRHVVLWSVHGVSWSLARLVLLLRVDDGRGLHGVLVDAVACRRGNACTRGGIRVPGVRTVLLLWILRVFHHPTERTRTKIGVAKMSRAKMWGGAIAIRPITSSRLEARKTGTNDINSATLGKAAYSEYRERTKTPATNNRSSMNKKREREREKKRKYYR